MTSDQTPPRPPGRTNLDDYSDALRRWIVDDRTISEAAKEPTRFPAWVLSVMLGELSEYRARGDVLSRLYASAGGGEVDTLDELAERAGLVWTCHACPWTNLEDATECETCGTAKPSSS